MKIAWVSSWTPRHCGIATYSYDLVSALRSAGHRVEVVCHTDGGTPGEKDVHPAIDLNSPLWANKLYRDVSRVGPDIVHIQHEFGLYRQGRDFAAGLFKPLFQWKIEKLFPVVVTYHSVYSKLRQKTALYMDIMQKLVDAGIVHEFYQYIHLPHNIGRIVPNMHVIPHGAKCIRPYRKACFKERIGFKAADRIIGLMGWFNPSKGFEKVIDNWDDIAGTLGPSTRLVLAGDERSGSKTQKKYKEKLLSCVNSCRHRDRIKVILGSFSPQEYENILKSFDVMVLPYNRCSQSGNLAHSFACGVPVIVNGIEGIKEEVEKSGAGIVVSPKDKRGLIQSIIMLMKDDEWTNRLSKQAFHYAKNKIGWQCIAQKHIDLYRKILRERKKKMERFDS